MRPIDSAGKTFMELRNPDFAVSEPVTSPGISILFEITTPIEPTRGALYNGTAVELSRAEAERLWTRLGNRLGKTV